MQRRGLGEIATGRRSGLAPVHHLEKCAAAQTLQRVIQVHGIPEQNNRVPFVFEPLRRYVLLKKMLRQFGVEEERVQLVWAAASEGNVLAAAVNRMTEQLRALGPLRWAETALKENGHQPAMVEAPVAEEVRK